MLIIDRRLGQAIVIDGRIEVRVTEIAGNRVKLGIVAPRECGVVRKEVEQAAEHNRAAVLGDPGRAAAALRALGRKGR